MTLQEFFTEHPKAALGFSGGVDSSYLLYAGIKAGADIRPYFTPSSESAEKKNTFLCLMKHLL